MRKTFLFIILVMVVGRTGPVLALTAEQKKVIDSGVHFFDVDINSSNNGCGGSLIGNTNAEQAFHFFVSKGYQAFQSAGIVGNMMAESGVLPQRLQGTKPEVMTPAESLTAAQLGDSRLGWGIVQFTPPGKFITTVTPTTNANDLSVQLEFVWNQLEGNGPIPEKRAGDQLKQTTTVEEAVLAFQGNMSAGGIYYGYERPKDQTGSVPTRTAFAKDILSQFGSGASIAGSGCGVDASGCPTEPVSQSETVIVQGIRVHPCISQEVDRIMTLATQQGIPLSGWGWVDKTTQEQKRTNNGCGGSNVYDENCNAVPPTAVPGKSRHEYGTAVDFTCSGAIFENHDSPCFKFLDSNTTLKNLPSEAWHWSVDGY